MICICQNPDFISNFEKMKRWKHGELVSLTSKQGLQICQDLKLQKHLKKELKETKKELGSFCQQFDNSFPQAKTCKGSCSKPTTYQKPYRTRRFYKKTEKVFHKKPFEQRKWKTHKKHQQTTPKPDFKNITCFKCGKKGHTARYCRVSNVLRRLRNIRNSNVVKCQIFVKTLETLPWPFWIIVSRTTDLSFVMHVVYRR